MFGKRIKNLFFRRRKARKMCGRKHKSILDTYEKNFTLSLLRNNRDPQKHFDSLWFNNFLALKGGF